jgi:DNA-binding CsgD family transcriptional regulator
VIQEDNMLELTSPRQTAVQPHQPTAFAPIAPTNAHRAPAATPMGRLLARALDEVDYAIVLLDEDAEILHLNHRGRQWLQDDDTPMQQVGSRLRPGDAHDMALLHDALQGATRRGLRRLLALGGGEARQVAALVPVEPGVAALVLGKSSVCEDLSLQCFARSHGLTPAETRVLAALGAGAKPTEIACEQGVKLSTVRTQIGAIRDKVGVQSITALLRLVASLPPMVGVLRG